MELLRQEPSTRAPGQVFTGDAWWSVIYAGQTLHVVAQFMEHLALWEGDGSDGQSRCAPTRAV